MSTYREQISATNQHLAHAAYQLETALRHHEGNYDHDAVSVVIEAVTGLLKAVQAIDQRLRAEEKILAE